MTSPTPTTPSATPPTSSLASSAEARGRNLALIAMVVSVITFSASSTAIKWANTPGPAIALWRMVFASSLWWVVLLIHRARTGFPLPTRRTWLRVMPAGIFFGSNIAIFFTAITRTSIAHAEFIASLSPLVLLPAGALIFKEHPNWKALRWGVITLIGVSLVLFTGSGKGAASLEGDLLMIIVLVAWVGYLLSTKWARRHNIHVIHFMACAVPMAMIPVIPIGFVVAGDSLWPLSGRAWLVVGLLAVLTGIIAHGLIVFSQKHLPVATIGIMQVGGPALAVFWAWLVLGESISPLQIPGMALVIIGLAAFTLSSQRRAILPLVVAQPPSLAEPGDD